MSYVKGSFDTFKSSLREGKYANATGARRAVGKLAGLSAEEKEKARKLIDHHFGESSSAAPKAKPAAKETKKSAAPARQPRTASAAPAAKKPGRQPRTTKPSTIIPPASPAAAGAALDELAIGERVVNSATSAINALQQASQSFGVDNQSAVREYSITLGKAVKIFRNVVNQHVGTDAEVTAGPATVETQPVVPQYEPEEPAPAFPELHA